jgi:DNA-binding transcriptional MocR family regulator
MDVDGRVLRFDSLSKILSAGLRLGWVTGPKELVDRIIMHTMVTNLQASGVPQAMAATLLNQWGLEGFFKHIDSVGEFYREKRDVFLECAERRLKGYAEWTVPQAGRVYLYGIRMAIVWFAKTTLCSFFQACLYGSSF